MSRARVYALLLATLALFGVSCGGEGGGGVDLSQPVHVDLSAPPPERLSSYNLFAWDPSAGFTFHDGVVPYDLNTPLFSDYALKQRAIYIPDGETATYDPEQAFDFPVGTVIVKNFYFPADFRRPDEDLTLIETRLLVRHEDGWATWPYIWDADQGDAHLALSGEVRAIDFIDREGETKVANYLVPQRNQCQSCHSRHLVAGDSTSDSVLVAIGPKARHLNRDYDYGGEVGVRNQLEYLAELGKLEGLPPIDSVDRAYAFAPIEAGGAEVVPPEDLDEAARDYLDINCSHCHNPNGTQGITSQLFLDHTNTDLQRLGVCKKPGSAGNGTGGFVYDIVPGDPDTSILMFRVATEEPGSMMPLLGRSLTHEAGAALLHDWIAAMDPVDCANVGL